MRAEGIASGDYPELFVDRGTVIIATRDYKPPNFTEIWEKHLKKLGVPPEPHPSVGGVGKFIRDFIKKQRRSAKFKPSVREHTGQQLRKGGRGWIHYPVSRRI